MRIPVAYPIKRVGTPHPICDVYGDGEGNSDGRYQQDYCEFS